MTMTKPDCGVCSEPPCVCADVAKLLDAAMATQVGMAAFMKLDTFDIGTGQSLVGGQRIANLFFHPPGSYEQWDKTPEMLTVAFDQQTCAKLIHLMIRAYQENWGSDE